MLRENLAAAMTDEDIAALIEGMKELPVVLQYPFFQEMKSNLASKGYKYENKSSSRNETVNSRDYY
ncbi:hypothetical protein [Bacteroides sp. 14(A)]|uniref:hypothetical protein n=1 Tax=Bacteroides sp. 14(A) TaxID=1163670 RepID=UPI001E622BBB|nr:hypothetical protein [Bacteroides sp. 14(A)]